MWAFLTMRLALMAGIQTQTARHDFRLSVHIVLLQSASPAEEVPLQFVAILMLSDTKGMVGGETGIRKGDGTIMKMRYPEPGMAICMQVGEDIVCRRQSRKSTAVTRGYCTGHEHLACGYACGLCSWGKIDYGHKLSTSLA